MALVQGTLVDEVLLDERQVVQRLHVQVLVVGQDEDDVGLLARGAGTPRVGETKRLLVVGEHSRKLQARREGHTRQAHGEVRGALGR